MPVPVIKLLAIVVGALFCFASLPAAAEWNVESYKDRMTDKKVNYATLPANAADHGVRAVLQVSCLVSDLVGGLYLNLRTSEVFTPGRMGLRYRVDNKKPIDRYMPVDSSLHGVASWAQPEELLHAKRLRVEIFPAGSTSLFYEFELNGTPAAFKSIPCKKTRQ